MHNLQYIYVTNHRPGADNTYILVSTLHSHQIYQNICRFVNMTKNEVAIAYGM
jgi:hypothetical protein